MGFKTKTTSGLSLESPESLFSDIKSKKIGQPWASQADVWRSYVANAESHKDVAFQIPTGGGKTLIGIVLAEWWRRKNEERVVFLCPTRQLANQVAELSKTQYGIPTTVFTGPKSEYKANDQTSYMGAESIAVTTYSSLFNNNPFFDNPHRIILDDAHAAEQYISSVWTLRIYRQNHSQLYELLCNSLKGHISSSDYLKLTNQCHENYDSDWVQKLPSPSFFELHDSLITHIDELSQDTDLYYSWSSIRDHLKACNLYFSSGEIFIRPLISPTFSHRPFAQAKQRLYMSATLGQGGELERIAGVKKIHRIESSKDSNKQIVGRRYFIFPERNNDQECSKNLTTDLIDRANRALVITSNQTAADKLSLDLEAKLKCPIYRSNDIEISKNEFVNQAKAVTILANRYDGINFPGEECRLLVLDSIPQAMNLQERFLINRMGCKSVFNERITTRLIQAFGRCTRSDQDYSAIVALGTSINKQLIQPETRKLLPAELQSEINFGLENAKDASSEDFLENFDLFWEQGEDWRSANESIVSERSNLKREPIPGEEELFKSAELEVDYQISLWNGDYISAIKHAKNIISLLKHPDLRGFRTLWHYLAGSATWALHLNEPNASHEAAANNCFENATKANSSIIWLHELARIGITQDESAAKVANNDVLGQLDKIAKQFDAFGLNNDIRYNQHVAKIRSLLRENNSEKFEEGQKLLGNFLGFESDNEETSGAPDPWWHLPGVCCFVFEDYTEAQQGSALDIKKARQVATHPAWIKEHLEIDMDIPIIPVLISSTKKVRSDALVHLDNVYFWHVDDFRKWANDAISTIEQIRTTYLSSKDLVWQSTAIEKLEKKAITALSLQDMVINSKARKSMIIA